MNGKLVKYNLIIVARERFYSYTSYLQLLALISSNQGFMKTENNTGNRVCTHNLRIHSKKHVLAHRRANKQLASLL